MPEAQVRRGTTASGSRRGRPQHLKKGGLRRKQPRRHLDLGLRTSRSVRKLLGSSHPACGILFRDPQHTNPGPREVLVLTCVQLESKGVCVCVQCVSSLSCGLTDGILEGASPEDHVAARPATFGFCSASNAFILSFLPPVLTANHGNGGKGDVQKVSPPSRSNVPSFEVSL